MMTTTWDPLADIGRIGEQLDRLFSGASSSPALEFPAINVWANENEVLLTADLPGVQPADLELTVNRNILTLKGARVSEPAGEGQGLLRQERLFGRFERSVELPFVVDGEKIHASLAHGILKVTLPRAEADKPRRISVQAG
jgi:HSP20 family protein